MEKKYTILIAEDDADIIELLSLYLKNAGYQIVAAEDGRIAYEKLKASSSVDMAIVDIMMPGMNGYELIQKMRETMNIPVIILSAKDRDSDKILGLDIGADDYITKPFNPLEVVARVNAGLRRFYRLGAGGTEQESLIQMGELELNLKEFRFWKNGTEIPLTPMELKLLSVLMQNPGKVFTRARLSEIMNGNDYYDTDDNTLTVHISNLRDKIEEDSKKPRYLKTIRGLGYKFEKNV